MDLNLILVCVVIAVALFFSYTNGFHDAANAIATSVSTRAWTPRAALLMAAAMNIIGAMMGTAVAKTVGSGIIEIKGYAESTTPEGLGLGLSIVREIADMHSASLHFERLAKGGVRAELMIDRLATKDPEKNSQLSRPNSRGLKKPLVD